MRRRLPLAAAVLSGALVVPSLLLAAASPMALDGGQGAAGWLAVLFLVAQPVMLAGAAVAGILCYRRFSKARFLLATAPPLLCLIGMKLLNAA